MIAQTDQQPGSVSPIVSILDIDPDSWTIDERLEFNRQARMEKARMCAAKKDILGWGRALFPDKFQASFCPELHSYLVDVRAENFTSTEAPRGHAKTTIKCFLIPIFQALVEPEAFRFYLNVQATDDKALAINRAIKMEIETNREVRDLYGNQVGDRWTDQEFVLNNGVVFMARSAGQSIKGINYRNLRPDYILVDDLYNEDDLNNPESTQKKNAWFWGTLYKTMAVGRRTSLHFIGTAVNNYDLLALLAKDKTVKSRTFRAVNDDGSFLWSDIWVDLKTGMSTQQVIEKERSRMSSIIWAREMQNDRWDEVSAIVKRGWLANWEYDPKDLIITDRNMPGHMRLIDVKLLCDPSIGKKLENDDTAIIVMWKTQYTDSKAYDYWIHYAFAEHLSLNERVLKLDDIADAQPEKYKINKAFLEAVGGFQDFGDEARRRTKLNITLIDKVKDKISNLMNKSVNFESGHVHLNKNLPHALKEKIIYQLTTNYPQHDDLRDAILLGLDNNVLSVWDCI